MSPQSLFRTWAEVRDEILGTLPGRTLYWPELYRLRALSARERNPRIKRARVLYRRKRRHW